MKQLKLILFTFLIIGCNNHTTYIINHPITPYYLYFNKSDLEINLKLLSNYCNELHQKDSKDELITYLKNNKYKIQPNDLLKLDSNLNHFESKTIRKYLKIIEKINKYDYKYIGYSTSKLVSRNKQYVDLIYIFFQSSILNCIVNKECNISFEFILENNTYKFIGMNYHPKPENNEFDSK